MNVLLINGSPHAHGCTDAALQEIAKALNADGIETTIYHIGACLLYTSPSPRDTR